MRVGLGIIGAAALAVGLCVAAFAQERPDVVGRPAPAIELPIAWRGEAGSHGAAWTLPASPARPVVLVFVGVECPVSNAYNERLTQLAKDYAGKADLVGVNANRTEGAAAIARHAEENRLPFPVLKDAENRVADLYGAQVTPEAFIVDTRGVVRYHGRIDNSRNPANVKDHELRDALDASLAGKPVETPRTQAFGCAIQRAEPRD